MSCVVSSVVERWFVLCCVLLLLLKVRLAGFSPQELSSMVVSLARLKYRPGHTWLDAFAAAVAARMSSFEMQVRSWGWLYAC